MFPSTGQISCRVSLISSRPPRPVNCFVCLLRILAGRSQHQRSCDHSTDTKDDVPPPARVLLFIPCWPASYFAGMVEAAGRAILGDSLSRLVIVKGVRTSQRRAMAARRTSR